MKKNRKNTYLYFLLDFWVSLPNLYPKGMVRGNSFTSGVSEIDENLNTKFDIDQ
jgi:hypothetical protein